MINKTIVNLFSNFVKYCLKITFIEGLIIFRILSLHNKNPYFIRIFSHNVRSKSPDIKNSNY